MLDEYRSLEVEGCLQELANLPSEVGPIPWVSGMWFHNEGLTSNTKNDSVTLNSISIGIYVSFCIAWESEHYTTIVTWGRDERRRALSEVSRRSNPIPGMGAWQNERTWGLLYNIEVIEDQANLKETRLENCFFFEFLRKYDTSPKSMDFFDGQKILLFQSWDAMKPQRSDLLDDFWGYTGHLDGHKVENVFGATFGEATFGQSLDDETLCYRNVLSCFFWNVHYMCSTEFIEIHPEFKKQSCLRGLFDGMLTVVSRGTFGWRSSP